MSIFSKSKRQAILLFIVSPIGALGAFAFLFDPPPHRNIPTGLMMAIVSAAGIALGVWLWRKK